MSALVIGAVFLAGLLTIPAFVAAVRSYDRGRAYLRRRGFWAKRGVNTVQMGKDRMVKGALGVYWGFTHGRQGRSTLFMVGVPDSKFGLTIGHAA